MRTKKHPFKANEDSYYDLYDDWDIINVDLKKEYNGRGLNEILLNEKIKWSEFSTMISNLSYHSGLANLVRIRSEKDPVKIKQFNSYERKIYLDWKNKRNKNITPEQKERQKQQSINLFINALQNTGNIIEQ